MHIHLLGICGTGMAALAGILKEQGHRVSGSDEHAYPPMSTYLAGLGIAVQNGYAPENLVPRPDLAVVGNVIRRDNPEAQALLGSDIPRLSLPEALNRFLVGERRSLVVAGTHGKTTTTALIAWLLYALGLDPGFMVGGLTRNFEANYRVGRGPYVVLEGDEYDTAFFDKRPNSCISAPRWRCSPPSSSTTPISTPIWTRSSGPSSPFWRRCPQTARSWPGGMRPWCGRSAGARPRRSPFTARAPTAIGGWRTWRPGPGA